MGQVLNLTSLFFFFLNIDFLYVLFKIIFTYMFWLVPFILFFLLLILVEMNINQLDGKKKRIKGPSVSLTIFKVSILFILYYFVFMVSHHVSFNNSIDPYLCFNQIELYIYLFIFLKKKYFLQYFSYVPCINLFFFILFYSINFMCVLIFVTNWF